MNSDELPKSNLPENRRWVSNAEIDQIKDSLEGLRYGAVQIIVQDGVIVQIDRTEKLRLRRPNRTTTNAADTKR